jgi:hypothetical protein
VIGFDLSGVTALDGSGVQSLMPPNIAARARHSELRPVAHSLAVLDVMDLLNLGWYFNNEIVITPGGCRPSRCNTTVPPNGTDPPKFMGDSACLAGVSTGNTTVEFREL